MCAKTVAFKSQSEDSYSNQICKWLKNWLKWIDFFPKRQSRIKSFDFHIDGEFDANCSPNTHIEVSWWHGRNGRFTRTSFAITSLQDFTSLKNHEVFFRRQILPLAEECLAKDRVMSANGEFQDFKKKAGALRGSCFQSSTLGCDFSKVFRLKWQVLKASMEEIDAEAWPFVARCMVFLSCSDKCKQIRIYFATYKSMRSHVTCTLWSMQAKHAPTMWRFLIAFAEKKALYRSLIIQARGFERRSWMSGGGWSVSMRYSMVF